MLLNAAGDLDSVPPLPTHRFGYTEHYSRQARQLPVAERMAGWAGVIKHAAKKPVPQCLGGGYRGVVRPAPVAAGAAVVPQDFQKATTEAIIGYACLGSRRLRDTQQIAEWRTI